MFNNRKFTSAWEDLSDERPYLTSEELVLRNTFINARLGPVADFRIPKGQQRVPKLTWIDQNEPNREKGIRDNDLDDDLLKKKEILKIQTYR